MKFRLIKNPSLDTIYSVEYFDAESNSWRHLIDSSRIFHSKEEAQTWFNTFELVRAEREIEPPAPIEDCIIAEKEIGTIFDKTNTVLLGDQSGL